MASLPDTRNTGALDGFKDPDDDQWTNLEEFRRRTDPLLADPFPQRVELKQPTLIEIMQVAAPKSDLRYEPAFYWREPGSREFVAVPAPVFSLFSDRKERAKFDVQIFWRRPQTKVQR